MKDPDEKTFLAKISSGTLANLAFLKVTEPEGTPEIPEEPPCLEFFTLERDPAFMGYITLEITKKIPLPEVSILINLAGCKINVLVVPFEDQFTTTVRDLFDLDGMYNGVGPLDDRVELIDQFIKDGLSFLKHHGVLLKGGHTE